MRSKIIKIVLGLLVLLAVAIGLTSINHPVILKWVTASARHFGKPIHATIYTNGQVNNRVKVFYTDEPNNYLLSLAGYDSPAPFKFININLEEKWIGTSFGTSEKDYDFIAGHLFLTNTGQQFSSFRDETRKNNFDPQLSFTDRQLKFNMPPNQLGFDSVRILLP
jgi:hypothetical protein